MADTKRDKLIVGVGEPAAGLRYARIHEGAVVEIGNMRPLKDGMPINPEGKVVRLHRTDDGLEVEDLYGDDNAESDGPAMVNSSAYRTGWDRIFGKTTVGDA